MRGKVAVQKRNGFTLVELLVVIAVISLLMAILLATLHRVKDQARSIVCRSSLNQWGLMFTMYAGANDGKFFLSKGGNTWVEPMSPYYSDSKDSLLLCPMATKHYVGNPSSLITDPAIDSIAKKRFWAMKYIGAGTRYHAWLLLEPEPLCSYGLNDWVMDHPSGPSGIDSHWRMSNITDASNVPVFLDCVWRGARPHYLDPPLAGGDYPPRDPLNPDQDYSAMQYFCIDRHGGGINSAFMDGSARKVGLKGLWALKWHRHFPTNGPWTMAGGVRPAAWPQWMRGFKDY
jgi:prepilin-type N-terminal cleavage/methylation domain-containing protein/prepilin-type processing-associated H-X9-DG protein